MNLIKNAGPVVEEYAAEQDRRPFLLGVKGVRGAYIVFAKDRDDLGFFDTIEEARDKLKICYGAFIVDP
jgi:hypothetical protein